MQLTTNYVRKSTFEWHVFTAPNFNVLKESKTVRILCEMHGKTRVSISMHFGVFCQSLNFQVEGIKTHVIEHKHYSNQGPKTFEEVFFVISKKQGAEKFKLFCEQSVMKQIGEWNCELDNKGFAPIELDELKINIEWVKPFYLEMYVKEHSPTTV